MPIFSGQMRYKNTLIIIDHFIPFVLLYAVPGSEAETVARALIERDIGGF